MELRPGCECCDVDLPPGSTEAWICSFECTFCRGCVEGHLMGRCPNCGGNMAPRPLRPEAKLMKFPASTKRVHKPLPCTKAPPAPEVHSALEALATAWNQRDWERFGRLFAEDAEYVTGAGGRLSGRRAIQQEAGGSEAGPVALSIESLRHSPPDLALVLCGWSMAGPSPRVGRLSLVLRRAGAAWEILSLHNTDRAN